MNDLLRAFAVITGIYTLSQMGATLKATSEADARWKRLEARLDRMEKALGSHASHSPR